MSDAELDMLGVKLAEHARGQELSSGAGYFQEAGDQDFHFLIAQGSKSGKLIELLCEGLYYLMRVYRFRSSIRPGRAGEAFGEHTNILTAMRARDPDRAEALMREHIAQARRILAADVGRKAEDAA
jgi:DNA-binding GntR family transcriptional regulator